MTGIEPLRITLLNTLPIWGGGERWILDTARGLAERDHEIRVVASVGGELLRKTRAEGLPVDPMPPRGLDRLRAVRGIRRRELTHSPLVLLANTGRDVRLATAIRPRGRVALVFNRQLDRPLGGGLVRRLTFRHLDLVIANSDATRCTMRRSLSWLPEDRVVTVYNAFDAERFRRFAGRDVRAELGLAEDALVIGVVARLARQKGHEILFRAFPRIREAIPGAVLLLVGSGGLEQRLRDLARDLGIADACRFVGHADPVQPFYQASDLVAIPSLFEGFCYTAVEAQALGKPVVASRVSSLPEVVGEGDSGLLVPPHDPEALGEGIIALGRNPEHREKLGRGGRRMVERFSPARVYGELEDQLSRVLPKV